LPHHGQGCGSHQQRRLLNPARPAGRLLDRREKGAEAPLKLLIQQKKRRPGALHAYHKLLFQQKRCKASSSKLPVRQAGEATIARRTLPDRIFLRHAPKKPPIFKNSLVLQRSSIPARGHQFDLIWLVRFAATQPASSDPAQSAQCTAQNAQPMQRIDRNPSHQRGVGFGVSFGAWQESLEGDAVIKDDDVHRCATTHKSLILFGWVSQVLVFSSFFPALA